VGVVGRRVDRRRTTLDRREAIAIEVRRATTGARTPLADLEPVEAAAWTWWAVVRPRADRAGNSANAATGGAARPDATRSHHGGRGFRRMSEEGADARQRRELLLVHLEGGLETRDVARACRALVGHLHDRHGQLDVRDEAHGGGGTGGQPIGGQRLRDFRIARGRLDLRGGAGREVGLRGRLRHDGSGLLFFAHIVKTWV
jgi:hypothetical protein